MTIITIVKNFIEICFSLGLFINAMLFLPQILKLLRIKNSAGLSLITFGGFSLIQLFTILHGVLTHDYLLIIGYAISLVMCGTLTMLIIYYNRKNKLKNSSS